MAKATLCVIVEDIIVSAVGPLQTCAGHAARSEAAVHAMKELFEDNECEATLFVDGLTVSTVRLHYITYRCFVLLFHQSY